MPEGTNGKDQPCGSGDGRVGGDASALLPPPAGAYGVGGRSKAARLVCALILFLVVGSVVFLLVSQESRLRLIRGAGSLWSGLYGRSGQAEIYRLPPPPPKAVEPRVVFQGSPTLAYRRGAVELGAPRVSEDQEETTASSEPQGPPSPPEKTEGANAAYELLLSKSDLAKRLTSGGLSGLEFKEWKPVRNDPPEFWVDLVAVRTQTGQEAHFIWSVHTENDTVRALSQDARDLERR